MGRGFAWPIHVDVQRSNFSQMIRYLILMAVCIATFALAWLMIRTEHVFVQWLSIMFVWAAALTIGRWWRGWDS
jgi:hypothetical protein